MNAPAHMLPRDMQLSNEYRFSRKHIDRYIDKEIRDNPDMEAKVAQGVQLLEDWRNQTYYDSKNARLAQLEHIDLEHVVRRIFIQAAYCQIPELFTSVTAQLAAVLKFSDKADGILTIAEMVAIVCITDAYDIVKPTPASSLQVVSRIPLSEKLLTFVMNSCYLPPMVCEPETLTKNMQSAYLTHDDSLILGKGNHHSGDICLDVLNRQNSTPLCLNTDFLSQVEEVPTFEIKDQSQQEQWDRFKRQSHELYKLMVKQGNRFYITNKVDKRGRIYSQGYQITPQGTSYKKASVDFADKEPVSGVPEM